MLTQSTVVPLSVIFSGSECTGTSTNPPGFPVRDVAARLLLPSSKTVPSVLRKLRPLLLKSLLLLGVSIVEADTRSPTSFS